MIKCIGCLIYDVEKDMVLLQQRAKSCSHSLKLGLWGGKMEQGESFSEALSRELREELGREPEYSKLYPLDTYLGYDNRFIYYSFLMVVNGLEDIVINRRESFDYIWMPYRFIHRLNLHPGLKKTIDNKGEMIEDIIETNKRNTV